MDSTATALAAHTALMAGRGAGVPRIDGNTDPGRLRQVAEQLEAQFLAQTLQPMFANLSAEQPYSGGHAEDMWRSLQVEEYGKAIARSGGIGLADAVVREVLRAQEQQGSP